MPRSALACAVTAAVALLLALLESPAALLTVALLLMTVPSGTAELTSVTTVTVAFAPDAREPSVQVSGCNGLPGMPAVQLPTLGVTVRTLTCAGIVSFMTTDAAVDGPALATVIV